MYGKLLLQSEASYLQPQHNNKPIVLTQLKNSRLSTERTPGRQFEDSLRVALYN